MQIPIQYNVGTEIVETKALIDSGAGGRFICEEEARKLKKPWTRLEKPIKVFNVDGTWNKIGWITHSVTVDITIGDRSMKETLLISGLGPEQIILGLPWLQDHNPDIDWVTGVVHFRPRRKIMKLDTGILDKVKDDEVLIRSFIRGEEDSDEIRINAKLSTSQVLAQAHEKKAKRFPPSRPYDHVIDLKPDFKPQDCKIYSLSPKERIEQDNFLDENLWKGYIRPSKSPMASPFFFVAKKEAGALRPCQDYRDLNNGTIKNHYPLLLVTDLMDKLKTAKVFTKLDLCNGYNNIRIKDGDQWKAAFKTPQGLFEPTVMFFGLTNSPATFQAFMNDILKDFIDGERLRENDLYLKPEKCEFEVTKTLFLGMIIMLGHISMDETKLAGITDWEVPKTVKDLVDEEENDNEDIVMLPDKLFVNVIDTELKTMLEEALPSDKFLQMTIESLIEKGTPPIKSSLQDWRTEGNLLFYKDRIYVPNDPTLRRLIVKTIHEGLPHGHPGQWNTVDQVQRDYWWPGMTKFIKSFVDGCAACQQMKVNTHPMRTPIQPIGGHKDVLPFQIILMDLITDLPRIADCDSILVVVDHAAMKGVIFIPCHKKIDTTDTAELLFQHVYKCFGLPDKIISDRDP
uniref:Reverse transcriptase-rnase h-integrase n=1 Tax=Moniliophthora roreri TaxID=221103 RepID=A0A0W0FYD8_MONRR